MKILAKIKAPKRVKCKCARFVKGCLAKGAEGEGEEDVVLATDFEGGFGLCKLWFNTSLNSGSVRGEQAKACLAKI